MEIKTAPRGPSPRGQLAGGDPPAGEITPDRLGQVLDRMARGAYGRPEVEDRSVALLATDLDEDNATR